MKRIYLLLIIIISTFTSVAQSLRCKTYEFAVGSKNEYGRVVWNDWKATNIPISINLKEDRIRIYSKATQDYQILELNDGNMKVMAKAFISK